MPIVESRIFLPTWATHVGYLYWGHQLQPAACLSLKGEMVAEWPYNPSLGELWEAVEAHADRRGIVRW